MTPARSQHYCSRCGLRRAAGGTCSRDGTTLTQVIESSLLGTEVGNYVVVRRLGEGGMGAVYHAIQPSIGAEVAIKVLHATAESHRDSVQRFLLEAQAVNRVRHGNLLRILDTGFLPDRRPYLVMELLDGITLADAVGKLPWPLACHVAAEALDALDAVHEENIVHRDLKPANIFLARDGRVVVLDFGIAKLVSADGSSMPVTRSGIIGTPEYMAPEQIRSRPLDRRTDVYAMGILLYETITGRRPFAAAATFDMLVQHLERPPTSPRDFVPELPPAVADLILCALEKAPEHRFASARAMATALRSLTKATRDDLVAFVTARAPARAPVPLDVASRDPGESAAGPTRVEGVPTTPGSGRRDTPTSSERASGRDLLRETRTVQPSDHDSARRHRDLEPSDIDAGATLPERPSRAPRERQPAPSPSSRRKLLGGLIAFGVAATIAIVVIATRDPDRPAPTAVAAPVPVTAPPPVLPPAEAPAPAVTTGLLEVKSTPPGARLVIDTVERGTTPVVVTLDVGAHTIRVELAGYQGSETQIDVTAGQRTSVVLPLLKQGKPRVKTVKTVQPSTVPTDKPPPPPDESKPTTEAKPPTEPKPPTETRPGNPGRKPNPFSP